MTNSTAAGWTTVRDTATAHTVARTRTHRENGMLVSIERQQLTIFTNGEILFYVADDTHPDAPWSGKWSREKYMPNILAYVSAPASTHTVEF